MTMIDIINNFCVYAALSEVVTNIYFGGGGSNMSIHLDNVLCNGTEPSLLNCTHNGIGIITNCDHTMDVGIKCKRSQGNTYKVSKNATSN